MKSNSQGGEDVRTLNDIPAEKESRYHTDVVCVWINSAFAVILFIICASMLNVENLRKMTYPLDGEGNLCGYDFPDYPYLYYTSPTDPVKRLCVSKCPQAGEQSLQCQPTPSLNCDANDNPKYEVQIVDTEMVINRVGIFCMPTDPEQRANIEEISQVNSKNRFIGFYDAFWDALWWAVIAGIIYLACQYFFPKGTTRYMFLAGTVLEIVGAFMLMIVPDGWVPGRLFFFFALLALATMSGWTLWQDSYRKQLLVCSELMECAVEAWKDKKRTTAYIPLFAALLLTLIVLVGFEILCVWSNAQLKFDPAVAFYDLGNAGGVILTAMIFLQFYWGMSFLKEAFNFCVSGYATNWYYNQQRGQHVSSTRSIQLLVKNHWGSVLGGSLVLSFLYFIDLFVDFISEVVSERRARLQNSTLSKKRDLNGKGNKEFTREFEEEVDLEETCSALTNLARSESMGYINLIPMAYCNASRYCEWLEEQSSFYDRSQITNRLYRLAAHVVMIFLCTIFTIQTNKVSSEKMDIAGVAVIIIICLFAVTFFISFVADIAEGILISVFLEEHLTGNSEHIEKAPKCVSDLYEKEKNNGFDEGNTLQNFVWPQ